MCSDQLVSELELPDQVVRDEEDESALGGLDDEGLISCKMLDLRRRKQWKQTPMTKLPHQNMERFGRVVSRI